MQPRKPITDLERDRLRVKRARAGRKGRKFMLDKERAKWISTKEGEACSS